MSAKDGPPGDPPPDQETEDSKSAKTGADSDDGKAAASEDGDKRTHPLLAVLFWIVAIGFSTFVAISNHWLADTLIALLPVAAFVIFIVWGIIVLRKK